MKVGGAWPDIDDYHIVLSHYAAAGHYRGAIRLLAEMEDSGIGPTEESFNFCFKAIAYHCRMPIVRIRHEQRKKDVLEAFGKLTERLEASGMGLTPGALRTMIHIHSLVMDVDGLEKTLRFGFGVDLANPDHHPPEFLERMQSQAEQAALAGKPSPVTPSISTSVLNAIILLLGETGKISKMITAFEVITSPLPLPSTRASTTSSSAFDEEEDDDPVYHDHLHPLYPSLPLANLTPLSVPRPNSFTYELLITYASERMRKLTGLHYLRVAMKHDRETDQELRRGLEAPSGPIHKPAVAVSQGMFRRIVGLIHRYKYCRKDERHARTLVQMAKDVEQWKQADLQYYTALDRGDLVKRGVSINSLGFHDADERPYQSSSNDANVQSVRGPFNILLHREMLRKERRSLGMFIARLEDWLERRQEIRRRQETRRRQEPVEAPVEAPVEKPKTQEPTVWKIIRVEKPAVDPIDPVAST